MHLCQALFGHVPRLFRKKNYMWADEHPNKDHADPISSFLWCEQWYYIVMRSQRKSNILWDPKTNPPHPIRRWGSPTTIIRAITHEEFKSRTRARPTINWGAQGWGILGLQGGVTLLGRWFSQEIVIFHSKLSNYQQVPPSYCHWKRWQWLKKICLYTWLFKPLFFIPALLSSATAVNWSNGLENMVEAYGDLTLWVWPKVRNAN